MAKHVKFNSTVTGASVEFVIVKIQGVRVSIGTMNTVFEQDIDSSTLNVEFDIAGPNGSAYSIAYTCKSDGTAVSDINDPTPVTGTIDHFNGKIENLKIPL